MGVHYLELEIKQCKNIEQFCDTRQLEKVFRLS